MWILKDPKTGLVLGYHYSWILIDLEKPNNKLRKCVIQHENVYFIHWILTTIELYKHTLGLVSFKPYNTTFNRFITQKDYEYMNKKI